MGVGVGVAGAAPKLYGEVAGADSYVEAVAMAALGWGGGLANACTALTVTTAPHTKAVIPAPASHGRSPPQPSPREAGGEPPADLRILASMTLGRRADLAAGGSRPSGVGDPSPD